MRYQLRLALVVAVALIGLLAIGPTARSSPVATSARALTPQRYAQIASGVVLIESLTCGGRPTAQGTGFLIGDRIVMTARHVVDPPEGHPACRTRVRVQGQWVPVQSWSWWYSRKPSDGRTVDMAVLKLRRRVSGHLFEIRSRPVPIGTNVATIGHPLGNQLSVTQGRVLERRRFGGVPLIVVRLLGGEGGSGSPFVDDEGNVVGILQLGLGGKDVLGQRTSGTVAGLDLNSWWGSGKRDLCRSYPDGGIPMCRPTTVPTPKPPAPACVDKSFLATVGPDWKAATDAWTQWNAVLNRQLSGDFVSALETALDAIEQAASSASVFVPSDVCSPGLKEAIALISGAPTLTDQARTAFQTFLGTPQDAPEFQQSLSEASTAISAVDARVKAIDGAFASR